MTQIFGIHRIEGLPTALPDNIYQARTQNRSSVYISSDCVGAKIFIDGIEQTGFITPSMITDIPSGHHNFRLTNPGYTDIESEIPLDPGKTYNIFLTMGRSALPPTDSSGIILLLAIGLVGYFLIKNK